MFCWVLASVLVLTVVLAKTFVMGGGGGGAFERILLLWLDITDFTFFMQL
jgi:hypothetical protein